MLGRAFQKNRCSVLLLTSVLAGCEGEPGTSLPVEDPALSPAHCSYDAPRPGPGPEGATAAGALSAGVGEAELDMPVGTPLGGYTARVARLGGTNVDGRRSRRAYAFVPSAGVQARPLARALYLSAGDERLLLLKLDVCVATDRLVYDLEQLLSPDAAAPSLRGRVIVAASHTHAGWATYQPAFHLSLGFDKFQETQYQRVLASAARAAKEALAAPRPAKLGAGIWDGWDPQDQIFSDRRGADDKLPGKDGKPRGKTKDGRLLVLRVDDQQDQPLAALVHFPMHGIVGGDDNPFASVDATGHVELALEEQFDRRVLVMHLQSTAGDVSPRGIGGQAGCKQEPCTDFARMESLGELAAPRIYSLWRAIKTHDQAELEVQSRAVPDGRSISVRGGALRYAPYDPERSVDGSEAAIYDEAGQVRSPITQFNVQSAAGLCGEDKRALPVEGIPGTEGVAPYGSCVELSATSAFVSTALKIPAPMLPDCVTTRTTLSALRLSGLPVVRRQPQAAMDQPPVYQQSSEELLLATLPGEPVTSLGDKLRAASPAGPDRTFVVGYAQGHVGYILDVENWLKGGYEPSINIYGPLEGEWLMERSLELLQLTATRQRESAETTAGSWSRVRFTAGTAEPFTPAAVPDAGKVVDKPPMNLFTRSREVPASGQPADRVPRVSGRALLVWSGGDPEEGTPQVVLEREEGGVYAPVRRRSGRPVDSRGKEMILTYTPQPVDAPPEQVKQHLWAVEWQAVGWDRDGAVGVAAAPRALPGNYRFRVQGKAGGKEYRLESRPFAVVREGALKVSAQRDGQKLSGRALYPVGAGFRQLRTSGPSDGDVPVGGALKVTVRSRADQKETSFEGVTTSAQGEFTVQPAGLDLSRGADLIVLDAAENSGQIMVP